MLYTIAIIFFSNLLPLARCPPKLTVIVLPWSVRLVRIVLFKQMFFKKSLIDYCHSRYLEYKRKLMEKRQRQIKKRLKVKLKRFKVEKQLVKAGAYNKEKQRREQERILKELEEEQKRIELKGVHLNSEEEQVQMPLQEEEKQLFTEMLIESKK